MSYRLSFLALLLASSALPAFPAEETAPKTSMKDELKAQLERDAKNAPAMSAPSSPASPSKDAAVPMSAASKAMAPEPAVDLPAPSPTPSLSAKEKEKAAAAAKAKDQPVTMMPKVEVRKNRVTELDRQLATKDKEIADEAKKTKATETDKALNDSKTSGFLSIFGGRSAEVGESLAKQRVMLLELERELIEEMALAKTKEEKADLQKQIDEIKAMRRDLEKPR